VPSPVLGYRHKNQTKYVVACIVAGLSVVGCTRSAEGQKPTPAQLSEALLTTTNESGAASTTALITGRDIGDESISWSDTIIPPPGTEKDKRQVIGRTTIARFGDIIMVLQLGDVGPVGSTELMNEDEWWSVVETAGKRLDTLDEQVHD